VSDGLLADLGHLLRASGVGARVYAARIPVAPELYELEVCERLPAQAALELALSAGDDYELVFTLPPLCATEVSELAAAGGVPLRCIGEVMPGAGVQLVDERGHVLPLAWRGFEHFSGDEGEQALCRNH
jgi:thiamine-monophosphate kinase